MKYTHTGIVRGCDSRSPAGLKRTVKLRETKLYWIAENGLKYRKGDGWGTGDWPSLALDIETVKPISD